MPSAADPRLHKLFLSLDVDRDQKLAVSEILRAIEKTGQHATLTEVHALIHQFDADGDGALNFEEFCVLSEQVESGRVPATEGLAKLIRDAWEEYIRDSNKTVEKNKVIMTGGKGAGQFNKELPQGQKWSIKKEGAKKTYKGLPPKKDLSELP